MMAGRPTLVDCMAALGARIGLDARLNERLAEVTRPGELFRVARANGLHCRPLRLDWERLGRLALPAVVTFTDGSSLLLTQIVVQDGAARAILADPRHRGADPVVVDRLRFEAAWTGTVIVTRSRRNAAAVRPFGWRRLFGVLLQEPRLLRDLGAASLALGLLAVAPILFVDLVFGRAVPFGATHSLVVLSIGLLVAVLMEIVLGAARGAFVATLSARTDARLAIEVFDLLQALPLVALERFPAGELARRAGGLGTARASLGGPLATAVLDMAALLAVLPLMAVLAPLPTTAVIMLGALGGIGVVASATPMRRLASAALEAEGQRTGFLLQTLAGIGTIKGLALGRQRRRQWDRRLAAVGVAELALARRADALQAVAPPAERLLVVGTLALGLVLSALNGTPAGTATLVGVFLLAQRLLAPLRPIGALARAVAEARAAVLALGAVAAEATEGVEPRSTLPPLRGAIAFQGVRFTYPGGAAPVLSGVSFAIEAGTTLGIMGPSGAGKSTVARLLQRHGDSQFGVITLDGTEITAIPPSRVRRTVAVVGSADAILAGTIRDTITAARPEAGFDDMVAAAKAAGADEFIERLPRGYETHLHEGAAALSAGQRQRLVLARALVADPAVLILDEALSALDAETAARVDAGLRDSRRERTTIVISHRLAALVAADAILVLVDGAVHDLGTHADLLERCDLYADAWLREAGEREPDPFGEGLLALA